MAAKRMNPGLFLCLALAYLLTLNWSPYSGQFLLKVLPIAWLAMLVFGATTTLPVRWLEVGLVLSGIADMLLTRSGEMGFLAGVAVFGLAHSCYAVAFWLLRQPDRRFFLRAFPVIVAALITASALRPHLGALLPAVFGYVGLITLAGVAAATLPPYRWPAYAGMLLFMTSDAIIAFNRFVTGIPAADYLIMTTYYAAQFLIATGILRASPRAPQSDPARPT